jgi:hypothetical protein
MFFREKEQTVADPKETPDQPLTEQGPSGGPADDLGLVPAQGKHAARPSEAERHQALHDFPQTDAEALRREGVEPDESHTHLNWLLTFVFLDRGATR